MMLGSCVILKEINELAERIRSLDSEMNNQIRKAQESSNEMSKNVSAEEEQEEVVSKLLEN